jgi:hypothetical protein
MRTSNLTTDIIDKTFNTKSVSVSLSKIISLAVMLCACIQEISISSLSRIIRHSYWGFYYCFQPSKWIPGCQDHSWDMRLNQQQIWRIWMDNFKVLVHCFAVRPISSPQVKTRCSLTGAVQLARLARSCNDSVWLESEGNENQYLKRLKLTLQKGYGMHERKNVSHV